MSVTRILVTDGEERAALAIVRSLGRAGYTVFVVSREWRSLAGSSRYATDQRSLPDPLREPEAYAEELAEWVEHCEVDVLLPMTEASLHALLPERDRFTKTRIPFPDYETFRLICDKKRVLEEADDIGIAVPRQRLIMGPGDQLDPEGVLRFPLVLKPSRSVVSSAKGRRKTSVAYVEDHTEVRMVLEELPSAAFPVLAQEHIVGPGIGVFLLLWDGDLLAAFFHRRLREKPPSGGVSVLRESVPIEDDLLKSSRQLLERFGWRGVAMVEYKRDARTDVPYIMEVNGRFWGSLQLAVDAGVDFPRLLVEAAAGLDPDPVTDYLTGVRTRWIMGDVDHLWIRLRDSAGDLSLIPDAPGRLRTVADFLSAFGPGTRSEIFRLSDPMPGFRELFGWLRGGH